MKKIDPSSLIQLLPNQLPLIEPRPEIPNFGPVFGDDQDNTLTGTQYADWLFGLQGDDTLNGLDGDDLMYGGMGADFLYGDGGTDSLYGGEGNDVFFVEDATDSVSENVGEGEDTIVTPLSFDLSSVANVENLRSSSFLGVSLLGNALDNQIFGFDGVSNLFGREGDDTLFGGNGNDILNGGNGDDNLYGGPGQDHMTGGTGRDIYHVDNSGDLVFESMSANPNHLDTVVIGGSALFYSVEGQGIEGIYALDAIGDVVIRGSNTSQQISGNDGHNYLVGLGGDDLLRGEDGNDTLNGGEGNDTLSGSNGLDTVYGEGGDDRFFIDSSSPNFNLNGDVLWGGSGHDIFQFYANDGAPIIKDFSTADDLIYLWDEEFPGLSPGYLEDKAFFRGAGAETSEHRIIYNQDLGRVYFDQDGAGGVSQVLLVNLSTRPKDLSAADFVIV